MKAAKLNHAALQYDDKVKLVKFAIVVFVIFFLYPSVSNTTSLNLNPNDFVDDEFNASRALGDINAQYAYARGYTGKGVLVAFLDTGLMVEHPEFKGRIFNAYNYDDDQPWWDVSDTLIDEDTGKLDGHGTHVGGLIGAARDGQKMHGVAYEAHLMPIRGDLNTDWIGINKAIAAGARVFNGSYGPDAPAIEKHQAVAINEIINYQADMLRRVANADIVMVFAAGNDFGRNPDAAANVSGYGMYHLIDPGYWGENGADTFYRFLDPNYDYPDPHDPNSVYHFVDFDNPLVKDLDLSDLAGTILSVVAVDQGEIAWYSNHCGEAWHYCLAAPGGNSDDHELWSTHPEPSYGYYHDMSGTSMASPVTAGAAAVVRQAFPFMSARQTIETLLTTTNTDGVYGEQKIYGRGLLDLGKAVLGPGEFGADGFPKIFDVDTHGFKAEFGNDITGVGGLHKTGKGILRLTGNNTYTGATIIDGGNLVVDGETRYSSFLVGVSGALSGNGSVGSTVSFGRIAPGNSIGTLVFYPIGSNPALTTKPGSILEIEIDQHGNSDLLDVRGDAVLNGGQVQLLGLNGSTLGQKYDFMNVTGAISGTGLAGFSNDNYAFIDLQLLAGPNNYALALQRNSTSFASLAKTKNQSNTAAAIERSGPGALPFEAIITTQDTNRIPAYYEQFSGELHASLNTMMYADSQIMQQGLLEHISYQQITNSPIKPAKGNIWGQAMANWGNYNGVGISHKARRFTSGLMLGRDFNVNENSILGLAFGYTKSRTLAENRNTGDLDAWHLMAYGSGKAEQINLRGGLGYSWYTLDTRRNVAIAGIGKQTAKYHGNNISLFAQAAYSMQFNDATIEPYIGFNQTWQHTNSFSENGQARLKAKSAKNSFTQSELGIKSSWLIATDYGDLNLGVGAAWLHNFGSLSPKISVGYQGENNYQLYGVPLPRNALRLELKAGLARTVNTSVDVSYMGQMGSGVEDYSLRLQVIHKF